MKAKIFFRTLTLGLALGALPLVAAPSKSAASTANGIRDFGFGLFKSIYDAKGKEPVAISPLSIAEAMTLVSIGSEAETREELEALFGPSAKLDELLVGLKEIREDLKLYAKGSDGAFEFTSANALWANSNPEVGFTYKPAFLKEAGKSHAPSLVSEDFKSPATISNINGWVAKATKGKIKELIQALGEKDVAVLLNAIYAKGTFLSHFHSVSEGDYTNANGDTSKVSYLSQATYLPYTDTDADIQMVSLPIGKPSSKVPSDQVALDILVAKDGKLDTLAAALDSSKYSSLVDSLSFEMVELKISAGKVEQSDALSLSSKLQAAPFRLVRSFDQDLAQFGLLGSVKKGNKLYISEVLTKTFYEVTPFGFEAAAATAVSVAAATSLPPLPKPMSVTGPSIHVVRHVATGMPLFISVYDSPQLYDTAKLISLVEEGGKNDRSLFAETKNGTIQLKTDYTTGKKSIVIIDSKGKEKVLKVL